MTYFDDDYDLAAENHAREQAQEEAAKTGGFTDGGGVTLTIDMDAFLRRLAAYGQDPQQVVLEVAGRTLAGELREALVTQITQAAGAEIKTQVAQIVTDALSEEVAPVDDWGRKGAAKSLRTMIQEEALKQTKVTGRGSPYDSDKSAAAKFISSEIDRLFKNELQQHLTAAKAAATAAVKQAAGEVISETIERARKGLV